MRKSIYSRISDHDEFVVDIKDEYNTSSLGRDWVDPVHDIIETEKALLVDNGHFIYRYSKHTIKNWTVRPYSKDTAMDPIAEPDHD